MLNSLVPRILGWWLVITLILITGVDVIALVNAQPQYTVSRWVYDLGQRHPWIYLIIGITLGHILFPLLLANGRHPE